MSKTPLYIMSIEYLNDDGHTITFHISNSSVYDLNEFFYDWYLGRFINSDQSSEANRTSVETYKVVTDKCNGHLIPNKPYAFDHRDEGECDIKVNIETW